MLVHAKRGARLFDVAQVQEVAPDEVLESAVGVHLRALDVAYIVLVVLELLPDHVIVLDVRLYDSRERVLLVPISRLRHLMELLLVFDRARSSLQRVVGAVHVFECLELLPLDPEVHFARVVCGCGSGKALPHLLLVLLHLFELFEEFPIVRLHQVLLELCMFVHFGIIFN